jgi:hypothetical protein
MKNHVSDAVAFLYSLLDKLPRDVNKAFKEAEAGKASAMIQDEGPGRNKKHGICRIFYASKGEK